MSRSFSIITAKKNHTAGDLGSFDRLMEYEVPNPVSGSPIPGKVFLAESLHATGMEISFQVMPPHAGMPFAHKHGKNEEIYVILSGYGEFQVDDDSFPVEEGSVVRIAPEGIRTWKNTGDEPMIVMCMQAVAKTLTQFAGFDGRLA